MNLTAEILERHAQREAVPNRAERRRLARRPAERAIRALGAALHMGTAVDTHVNQVPGWLRISVLDALAAHMNGTANTCQHSPRGDDVVVAAAWRPGLVVCLACAHLLAVPPRPGASCTCDACGHQCTGQPGDLMWQALVQVGPLIYQYGVCRDCKVDVPGGSP